MEFKFVENLIAKALKYGVSDAHINDSVYFRINKEVLLYAPRSDIADSMNIDEIASLKRELEQIVNNANEKSVTISINGTKCRITSFLSGQNQEQNLKSENLDSIISKPTNNANFLCFAIRILRTKIPTLADLNTPKILESLAMRDSGLVLVCGATGVGKSTSLAAMINHINQNCKKHILTIEDPVEYEHVSLNSLVTQREISRDSSDFEAALRASLRQDPDVILIGEILESSVLKLAINHALSGHLVLASFHAYSCSHAIARVLGLCSGDTSAHANLADCLQGVITQKLYKDGDKLSADFEILIANNAVKVLIKENKINQLDAQISMGREHGMQHFRN